MKRIHGIARPVAVVVAFCLVALAVPARAADCSNQKSSVRVVRTSSSTFDMVVNGGLLTGPGHLELVSQTQLNATTFFVTHTFTFNTPNGDVYATGEGLVNAANGEIVELLTITGGTGLFVGCRGQIRAGGNTEDGHQTYRVQTTGWICLAS